MKGRFIGECIRTTYDIIEYAKQHNKVGLLLCIDFEKAFDSISHSFIIKTLHFFGFGNSYKKWINLILNDLSSCINHCGNISERFTVGRSCRQGDPISPYLFILCAEILALKIRQDPRMKGFKLGNWQHKLDMYADDLTAYLDGSEESLKGLIDILDKFQGISGLNINLGKCKAVWVGRSRFSQERLCQDLKLIWSNSFTLLGIDFDSDLAKMDTNFLTKIEEIEKLYKSWLYRKLTPLGKITVVKAIALSKLSHVVLVCPHIGDAKVETLTKMSFKFLWSNKPDRMKREDAVLPISKGGLNMPEIGTFWDSLKCSWTRRFFGTSSAWHKVLEANLLFHGFEMGDILYGGPILLEKIAQKLTNLFWKNTLTSFSNLQKEAPFHRPDYFFNLNLFYNDVFRFGNNIITKTEFPTLWQKNVRQAGDLFDCSAEPPRILSRELLNEKFGIRLDFLSYRKIRTSIESGANSLNNKIVDKNLSDFYQPRLPVLLKIGIAIRKGCSFFYSIFRSRDILNRNNSRSEGKWHSKLNTTFSVRFWDSVLKLPAKNLLSNKMTWTQIQINKHLLPTNYTVNHYDQSVSPLCSFCTQHSEELHTLMWSCGVVRQFWSMVANLLANFYPEFELGRKEALFGDAKTAGDSVLNTILSLARYFIWKQKFTSKKLDEIDFILYIKDHLSLIFNCKKITGKEGQFLKEWEIILEHFQVLN